MRVRVQPRIVRMREPLRTSWGHVRERTLFAVELEGDDGVVGCGEAAPLEPYDGVSDERCAHALDTYATVLERWGDEHGAASLLDACVAAVDLPQALAAIDLALWDRAGKRAGVPVSALLADDALDRVPVNATIGALDRAGAAEAAGRARDAGFPCVKLKVGTGDDAGRVAAVRAALGPEVALRLDANGAWSPTQAIQMIEALSPAGLELVEEPVHGVAALREVREHVAVRVALDETAGEPGALAAGVADAVCLKVSGSGGISGVLARSALVRANGAEVYLASTYDGPLGIAAALHCAAALRVELPCGLATLASLEGFDEVGGALGADHGEIAVPAGPGLLG